MKVRLGIYDLSGREILTDNIMGESMQSYIIKQKLTKGYYMLTVSDDEQFIVEKFKIVS